MPGAGTTKDENPSCTPPLEPGLGGIFILRWGKRKGRRDDRAAALFTLRGRTCAAAENCVEALIMVRAGSDQMWKGFLGGHCSPCENLGAHPVLSGVGRKGGPAGQAGAKGSLCLSTQTRGVSACSCLGARPSRRLLGCVQDARATTGKAMDHRAGARGNTGRAGLDAGAGPIMWERRVPTCGPQYTRPARPER